MITVTVFIKCSVIIIQSPALLFRIYLEQSQDLLQVHFSDKGGWIFNIEQTVDVITG
jgi:hypothetical protein